MKLIFNMGYYLQLKFFLAMIISALIIFIDYRLDSFIKIRNFVETSVSPLYFLTDLPRRFLDNLYETIISNQKLKLENNNLRREIFLKKIDLLKLQHYKCENFNLRKLLNSPLFKDEKKMLTQVISFNKNSYNDQLVIDKGSIDNVYEGQAIINEKGVVGQVINVSKITSRILLICDISHAIPIQILRNNIRIIASGNNCSKDLILEHMPVDTDIRVGDLLVTSGLGGRFPEGYPVAFVSKIKIDNKLACAIIHAKPVVNMNHLHYLLLLQKNNYEKNYISIKTVHQIAKERLFKINKFIFDKHR